MADIFLNDGTVIPSGTPLLAPPPVLMANSLSSPGSINAASLNASNGTTKYTIFGDAIPPDINQNFKLTSPLRVSLGLASQTSQFDTYEFDSSFGMLGSYIGSNVRAALTDAASVNGGNQTFNYSFGSGVGGAGSNVLNSVGLNIGINYKLGEQQNTFGTPQYFRNLAAQASVPDAATQKIVDRALFNVFGYNDPSLKNPDVPNYTASNTSVRLQTSNGLPQYYATDYGYSPSGAGTMKGFGNTVSVSKSQAYPSLSGQSQVLPNGDQYTMFGQKYQVPDMGYKSSFLGDGSGTFASAVTHLDTKFNNSAGTDSWSPYYQYHSPTVGNSSLVRGNSWTGF